MRLKKTLIILVVVEIKQSTQCTPVAKSTLDSFDSCAHSRLKIRPGNIERIHLGCEIHSLFLRNKIENGPFIIAREQKVILEINCDRTVDYILRALSPYFGLEISLC